MFPPEDLDQEEPLISVRETRIDVSWSSLLKGNKRWERMEAEGLDVDVSIETIRGILARTLNAPAKPSVPVTTGPNEVAPTLDPAPQIDSVDPTDPADPPSVDPPVARKDIPGEEEEKSAPSISVEELEGLVILSDARVKIYSEQAPSLTLLIDQIEGKIPLWGRTREGKLSCRTIDISDDLSEPGMTIPLIWKDQSLLVTDHSLKVFGLDLKLSAAMKFTAGFPIGLQVNLPDQQLDLSSIFGERKSPLSVQNLTSKNRLQGFLLFPASFKGSSVTRFEDAVIDDPRDEGEMRFDRGGANLVASAGGIVARDIRAIGEEDAILMNGFASAAGEAAATIRIVSSPERAQSHSKRVRMVDGNLLMDFQPLITPDREFRDIRVEARDGAWIMDLGEDRSWVSLFAATRVILGQESTENPNLP